MAGVGAEVAVITEVTKGVVGVCVNQIKRRFNYLAHYHQNMVNLRANLQNLERRRREVQVKVTLATNNCEPIIPDVQVWLGEVDGKKGEAEEILKDEEIIGNGCWRRWFVNFSLRKRLSRKAMKKSVDLDNFLERGMFEIVADPKPPLAQVTSEEGSTSEMPAAGVDGGLQSRSEFLEKVMVAVKDPKIRIIRLCGMGGIGKTTIAKEVEKRARAERLFHEIAMVELNENPDIRTLQLHIAELLGLKFDEDAVLARAKRLCQRLNAKDQDGENKSILLILDNVWKKEDLEKAGIPLTDEKSHCKILLTSRHDDVCKDIAPEPEFNIGVLPHLESMSLFRQCFPKEPSFYSPEMAADLVKECGGLPIYIAAIAAAVAGKDEESWSDVLDSLKKCQRSEECNKVFKVSYDFLENEEIKSFFRLFCFFRKGSDVPIEDLARCGMVLGCFPEPDNKLYEARKKARSYANKLLHSKLLLHGGKEGCFKVHDIVWDFAVHAPSNDLFITNNGDELIMSKRKERTQNYTSISLPCSSEMVKVPKVVDFQNLKFLQLIGNSRTLPLKFPNKSFEKMNELIVLAFRSLVVKPLPESLQRLNNLLSLSFDRCSIGGDISMIGNLVKLELLSFAYSDIQKLPLQIANLKALRLLDMTGCSELLVIPPDVLSKLSSLEELYMRGTPLQLRSGSPTLFSEIASMSNLVVIDIVMPVEVLPMDVLFAKLKHFKISVTASERDEVLQHRGVKLLLLDRFTSQRREEAGYLLENYLDLECDSIVLLQRGVKLLLQDTVRMDLNVTNLKNLFPLYDSEEVNFSKLQKLSIESCNKMVYLVNMMGHLDQNNVFQNLVSLRLFNLPCLVDIFHVSDSSQSFVAPFCNLKVLNVESCDELEHLFSSSDPRSLNRLEVIEVRSCDKLKVVLGKGRRGEEKVELRNLKNMTLMGLPNLVGFCSDVESPEFPQLEELLIGFCNKLKVVLEIGHFDSSHRDDSSSHPLFSYKGVDTARKFQKLRSLKVYSCHSLRRLLTTSIAISFPELQHLEVKWCQSLTTVIAEEGIKEEKGKNSATEEVMLFPKLKVLDLYDLTSLSAFMPKGYTLTWSSMKELSLGECGGEWNKLFPTPNKSNIQDASNKFALRSLEELKFSGMNIPSEFWYDYFPRGFSYELREFNVSSSKLSIIMFSPDMIRDFQHLTTICVNNCESMEVLFDLNKLDFLYIGTLPKMVNIWKKVPQNFQGFGNLAHLSVYGCDSLRYLFVPSIAKCLVKLKEMEIKDCKLIEEVVSTRDEEGQLSDDIILFPQLEELKLINLPSLKYLEAPNVVEAHDDVNATSTSTFNIISNQESIERTSPALVTLEGNVCPWPWSFHKLKSLKVKSCNNLLYIFPPNRVVRSPLLEDISVEYCENLQYIFSSSMATSLEQLKTIKVESCNNLLYIFSSSTAKSLEQLTELWIKGCKMMTEVIREDEEEVDGRIKIVFHSLKSLHLLYLPNLDGICLGMVSFDWPLLRSLNIINCLKMRIFTSGYSTTPDLEDLSVNGESYNPMMEEGDLNTVLRNAQLKVANLALKEEGTLLKTIDFQLAGDHLIAHYSTWSWGYEKLYLIARKVACLRRPRNTSTSQLVVEKQDQDQNEVDPPGDDEMNIYKPRTYDVCIAYDQTYKSTRLWVKGYDESNMMNINKSTRFWFDESNMDLPLDLVFQDINMKYLEESHVTTEYHPYGLGRYVSLFPSKESRRFAKVLFENLLKNGLNPNVQNHLQLFLEELFPTIQFGPTR